MDNEKYILEKIGNCDSLDMPFPKFIKLETSSNCTARCIMCGIDEWKRGNGVMKQDLFSKIADEIIQNKDKVTKVALFVGNEPLLDKYLSDRIRIFKNEDIFVNFSTNASLLDDKKARDILESGLDAINFSIDSLDKKDYEKIRKNLVFERILANAISFIQLRDKNNYKTKIRVSIIKSEVNKHNFDDIYNFWSRILNFSIGDSVRVDDLSYIYGTDSKKEDIVVMQGDMHDRYNYASSKPCYILWNTMVIKCDGSVALCNVDQCRSVILGNLNDRSISEIWSDFSIKGEIMNSHIKHGRCSVDLCKDCLAWLD